METFKYASPRVAQPRAQAVNHDLTLIYCKFIYYRALFIIDSSVSKYLSYFYEHAWPSLASAAENVFAVQYSDSLFDLLIFDVFFINLA